MTQYLFVATIDFNKLVNLDGLGAFISKIKAANQGQEASASILTEVNERLPSHLKDEGVTLQSLYVYYNIFVGVASLPEADDINDVTWQNRFVRPLMGAIFEPIYQETDPTGMSYLTWVLAPADGLTGGISISGASGGGGRSIGNVGVVGNTGK